jgi:FkbM family methyltransferase
MANDNVIKTGSFNVIVRGRDALYLANKNDAYVGRALVEYGEYGENEYKLLGSMVQPGNVVVEAGANLGAHTVRLAKQVTLQGRVIAYEPQPPIFQALCGTMALNGLMNIECYPYALGAEAGTTVIPALDYRQPNNFGGMSFLEPAANGHKIDIRKLDDEFTYPRLDLLKIDVEGMELDVLKGAAETIKKLQPMLYFENDRADKSPELLDWVQSAGYRTWWHFPTLFNPDNVFGNSNNLFGAAVSINVLALPPRVKAEIGLPEITDINTFPETTVDGGST